MILIGQYDSPFVRRVGIALSLYDIPFEHRPWSSFGNADELRAYNPLTRVRSRISASCRAASTSAHARTSTVIFR